MRNLDLRNLTNKGLVQRFANIAKERGLAVLDSDVPYANRMFHLMRAIDSELRFRGFEARKELLALLEDENRFVRYYAAKNLLAIAPNRSRAIIEWNAKYWFDAIAGDAGMTLDNLDSGFYKPD